MAKRAAKHRVKMWLESEKAMGLPSVAGKIRADKKTSEPQAAAKSIASRSTSPTSTPKIPATQKSILSDRPAKKEFDAIENHQMMLRIINQPFDGEMLSEDEKIRQLQELDQMHVTGCVKCDLSKTRDKTVFGEGNANAEICFVGEGPGKEEDKTGRPFVGRAGKLLETMIEAMGLKRADVFICNIVKCRAYVKAIDKDRPPTEEETATCTPYLLKQLEIIRPKAIVTLGLPSSRYLLQSKASMTSMRGNWHAFRGIKLMPTWHPAYVLRNYTAKTRGEVWDDLKKVLAEIGRPIPNRSGKQE